MPHLIRVSVGVAPQMFMTMVYPLCHESFSHGDTEEKLFSLLRVSVPPWQFSFTAKRRFSFPMCSLWFLLYRLRQEGASQKALKSRARRRVFPLWLSCSSWFKAFMLFATPSLAVTWGLALSFTNHSFLGRWFVTLTKDI